MQTPYILLKRLCNRILRLKPIVLYMVYLITVTLVLLISLEVTLYILARTLTVDGPLSNIDGMGYADATELLEIQREQRQCTLGLAKASLRNNHCKWQSVGI